MKKCLLLLSALFLLLQSTIAQNPFITNYTIADGLPTNKILCTYMDRNGFMWFGTNAGVIRFDGSNFINYTLKDGLSYEGTMRMKEDFSGRLWFLNSNGSVDYFSENKIHNKNNTPFLKQIDPSYYIHDFFQDKDSTLYFYNSISEIFVAKNDELIDYVQYNYNTSRTNKEPVTLFFLNKSGKGNFLLWTTSGTFEIGKIDDKLKRHKQPFLSRKVLKNTNEENFILDEFGVLYSYRDSDSRKKQLLQTETTLVNSVLVDKDNYVWVATFDQGVYCYKEGEIIFKLDIVNAQNLILDNENNIWAVSGINGIYKINRDILKYKFFDNYFFEGKGITSIAASNYDGLWTTNGKSLFFISDDQKTISTLSINATILSNIYQLKDNTILAGGQNTKMYIIHNVDVNPDTKMIEFGKISQQPFRAKGLVVDSTESYLYSFILDQLFITRIKKSFTSTRKRFKTGKIKNIFRNYNNEIIINAAKNYTYSDSLPLNPRYRPFKGKLISSQVNLGDGNEIIKVDNDKLFILNDEKHLELTELFRSQIDYHIKDMIYTDSTLLLFTIKTVYFILNPLKILSGEPIELSRLNIEFNNINDIYCRNNTIYVASADGLMLIPIQDCVNAHIQPTQPYFYKVSLEDEVYSITPEIVEYKDKKRLSIEFSSLNYSSIPSNYSYKLEGIDANWITGNETKVVYLNLPPGRYTFKLKSRKNQDHYSETIELPIIVNPTIMQRTITKLLLILASLFLIFLIIRFTYQRKIKQKETDHLLITLEHKALQSMMNPHFIFNALGSIQGFLLQNKSIEAGTYLSQFARLIRQNMNSLKSNFICVDDEAERLRNYIELEKLRMNNKFKYQIEIDDLMDSFEVCIPSMIVQPFVENAIWHGISSIEGEGIIRVVFKCLDEKSIEVIVEDNGSGIQDNEPFPKASHGLNMGVALTEKRLKLIGERKGVKSSISTKNISPGTAQPGTQIKIIVPIVDDLI